MVNPVLQRGPQGHYWHAIVCRFPNNLSGETILILSLKCKGLSRSSALFLKENRKCILMWTEKR